MEKELDRQPQQQPPLPQAPQQPFAQSPFPGLNPSEIDNDGWPVGVDPNDYVKKSDYEADRRIQQNRQDAALQALGLDVTAAREAAKQVDEGLVKLTRDVNQAQGTALTKREMVNALSDFAEQIRDEVDFKVKAGQDKADAAAAVVASKFDQLREKAAGDEERLKAIAAGQAKVENELATAAKEGREYNYELIAGVFAALGLGGFGAFRAASAKRDAANEVQANLRGLANDDDVKSLKRDLESGLRDIGRRLDSDRDGIPDAIEKLIEARSPIVHRLLEDAFPQLLNRFAPGFFQQGPHARPAANPDPELVTQVVQAVMQANASKPAS